MISIEKWMILTSLQKLPNNVGDLDKLIVAKGFKNLPKVQLMAQSGHTGLYSPGDLLTCTYHLAGPMLEFRLSTSST